MRVHTAATFALLGLAATAYAADATTLSDLPDLSTATDATTKTSATSDASSAAASTTDASSTSDSSAASSRSTTTTASSSSTSNSVFHLTGLPTIAGAGIPTLVIPYTAAAPFMQKSNLPEGTVFICIGAILGFLGACVLAWRAMIAYTINRSVKRAALASIMASSDSKPGFLSSAPKYGKLYNAPAADSTISLDALTSTGKSATKRSSHLPNPRKEQSRDPSALFFSPTAAHNPNSPSAQNRSSTYLPAGYYASPSAQAGSGASNANLAAPPPPYGRNGVSPPGSPALSPLRNRPGSSGGAAHLRAPSAESRMRNSWTATNTGGIVSGARNSSMLGYGPSSSSLAVGTGASESELGGSRAPSQYFDELLDHHGFGPRERY